MKYEELLQNMQQLDQKLQEQHGEMFFSDVELSDAIDESLEWWAQHMSEKYAEEKADADKCRTLMARYEQRAKMFEKRAEWRRKGLLSLVSMAGKSIKVASGTVVKMTAAATVDIVDENAIPEQFITIEEVKKIDRKAINKAVKEGLQGNWFTVKDGKDSIAIR